MSTRARMVTGAGLTRLRDCGCGAAFLPNKPSQQFCSRLCAARARPPRPRQPRKPRPYTPDIRLILRLLEIQPLERRARGGWRFGTRRIGESVVAKLIASGRAEIRGAQLHHKPTEAT
jgi:hypothetical protein